MTCVVYQHKNIKKNTWNTKHNYDLVISKQKSYCVIFCSDFPKCQQSITVFRRRD